MRCAEVVISVFGNATMRYPQNMVEIRVFGGVWHFVCGYIYLYKMLAYLQKAR